MEEIRVQKFLSEAGICSRRKAEELILEGKIKVNGKIIYELGTKINPDIDVIEFNNKIVNKIKSKHLYILLNKPIGYVTTVKDQFNRPTVMDLITVERRVLPVGRLDMYTSGALILTDDGEFINKVTHPRHQINKSYIATVKGIATQEDIQKLENGIQIDDYITSKAKAKIIKIDKEKGISRIEIIIHEGKNRQVRKMCESIGKKVLALHRTKIGNIEVRNLKLGSWRYLNDKEVSNLIK
ncbi:MAG: pseudouridine synthase [Candidatus Scatovivens sp.]